MLEEKNFPCKAWVVKTTLSIAEVEIIGKNPPESRRLVTAPFAVYPRERLFPSKEAAADHVLDEIDRMRTNIAKRLLKLEKLEAKTLKEKGNA